jgi:hypothetical protein
MRTIALVRTIVIATIASINALYCSDGCTRGTLTTTDHPGRRLSDLPTRIGAAEAGFLEDRPRPLFRSVVPRAFASQVVSANGRTPSSTDCLSTRFVMKTGSETGRCLWVS